MATLPEGLLTDVAKCKRLLLFLLCADNRRGAGNLVLSVNYSRDVVTDSCRYLYGLHCACAGGNNAGLIGRSGFNRQMGKNEAFHHAGNFTAAIIADLTTGYDYGLDFCADDL